MGNSCFIPARRRDPDAGDQPPDEGLGHSFCYIRPTLDSSDHSTDDLPPENAPQDHHPPVVSETSFKSISGASVSANTSTSRSIPSSDHFGSSFSAAASAMDHHQRAAAFESTPSFAALPLIPRSGPISGPISFSGPLERGFMSGPLERGFMSGPLEKSGFISGPLERSASGPLVDESIFQQQQQQQKKKKMMNIGEYVKPVRRALSKTVSSIAKTSISKIGSRRSSDGGETGSVSSSGEFYNLQWAQGKAGEDRVHIVLSEEHGWMFVGIYDGFNGPDAPDFLMSNLYPAVYKELQRLLCDQKFEPMQSPINGTRNKNTPSPMEYEPSQEGGGVHHMEVDVKKCNESGTKSEQKQVKLKSILGVKLSRRKKVNYKKLFRWRYDWEEERRGGESDGEEVDSPPVKSKRGCSVDHSSVLRALERALEATEDAYLEMTRRSVMENPELALVGSCLLVMLMKDEDVYIMNVGDSRAVLAQDTRPHDGSSRCCKGGHGHPSSQLSKEADEERIGARDSMLRMELERIIEETPTELAALDAAYDVGDLAPPPLSPTLGALQLSRDHSTSIEKEVLRIRMEHPDDEASVVKDRVKGRLKVTRAFGAGYLKHPKLNEAVLEMFRIDFVGEAPYITCRPYLQHHRLGPRDQFLVLSSDGLYQYLSNEEVVAHVEWFMEKFPDGDPAQYLIEELLFRAAKKAGMDFHELLDIPQGDRRKYHDDVSVMVISLEGRIWRSSG